MREVGLCHAPPREAPPSTGAIVFTLFSAARSLSGLLDTCAYKQPGLSELNGGAAGGDDHRGLTSTPKLAELAEGYQVIEHFFDSTRHPQIVLNATAKTQQVPSRSETPPRGRETEHVPYRGARR